MARKRCRTDFAEQTGSKASTLQLFLRAVCIARSSGEAAAAERKEVGVALSNINKGIRSSKAPMYLGTNAVSHSQLFSPPQSCSEPLTEEKCCPKPKKVLLAL